MFSSVFKLPKPWFFLKKPKNWSKMSFFYMDSIESYPIGSIPANLGKLNLKLIGMFASRHTVLGKGKTSFTGRWRGSGDVGGFGWRRCNPVVGDYVLGARGESYLIQEQTQTITRRSWPHPPPPPTWPDCRRLSGPFLLLLPKPVHTPLARFADFVGIPLI